MKVERNRVGNKYTFTPEDEKDEKFLDRIGKLEEENKTLKDNVEFLHSCLDDRDKSIAIMQEENKKLNEFKEKREESRFYFKAQMERAEPKTAREAEDLQRAKEIFEKLYREELNCLEEENKKLKDEMKNRDKYRVEENKRLRKGIDIRLDSWGVKYIMTEEGDYFAKSDFKITE